MDAVLPLLSDHSRAVAFAIAAAESAAANPPSADAVVLPLASKAAAAAAATPLAPLSACGSASAISVVVDITTTCGSLHVHHAVRLPKRACKKGAATGGGGDGRGAVRMRGPLRPRASEAEAGAEEGFVRLRATGAEAEAEEGLVSYAGGPGRAPRSKTRATVAATGLGALEQSPPRHITAVELRASPLRSTGGGALRSLLDKKLSAAPASPAQPSPPPRSQSYPLIASFFTNNSDPASVNVRAALFTRLSAQCPALPCLPRYLATFLPPSLHLPATFLCLQISFTQLVSDFNAAFLGSINVYLDELANAGSVGATAVASGTSGTNVQYIPLDSPPPYAQVTNRCRLPRW